MNTETELTPGVSHRVAEGIALGVSHPRERKRSINLRMNSAEASLLEKAAHSSGRSLAGFIRFAALQFLDSMTMTDSK